MAARRTSGAKKAGGDHGRNDQVVRVLELLRRLSQLGGADLYELAAAFDTTTRTIRRDLAALEAAGVHLSCDEGESHGRKRWSVDPMGLEKAADSPAIAHWLGLRVAMQQSSVMSAQSPYFAALEDLSERVEKALGPKHRERLRKLDRCFFSWDKFTWEQVPPDFLMTLLEATAEGRVVSVEYTAPSAALQRKVFEVLPLRLFVFNGSPYLHAWQAKHDSVITLNLRRIGRLRATEKKLPPPASYRTEDFEASAFGVFTGPGVVTYRLQFSKEVSPYIRERRWHPTQTLVDLPTGGAELTFTCARSYEVGSWVASWRWDVTVLEPAGLREEMGRLREHLAKAYGGGRECCESKEADPDCLRETAPVTPSASRGAALTR